MDTDCIDWYCWVPCGDYVINPDKNCFTLPNGECVGVNCMHDPEWRNQFREYCDRCDGVGWYEGGKYLQTTCEQCKGTGWADGQP